MEANQDSLTEKKSLAPTLKEWFCSLNVAISSDEMTKSVSFFPEGSMTAINPVINNPPRTA